jgi:hypothetical protein
MNCIYKIGGRRKEANVRGGGETVEARRVNLEDEVGKAKQEEQIDPLGRV